MTFDPLFFAGLAILIGGVAIGLVIIRRTNRWLEKREGPRSTQADIRA